MERLIQTLKDPNKLSLLLAALFFVGTLYSAYVLFTLPHDLVFKGGMTSSGLAAGVYGKVFTVIIITFGLGAFAINASVKAKKEIVVFKEKKSEVETNIAGGTESKQSSLDIQAFAKAVKEAKGAQAFQVGINMICQMLQAGQGAFYVVKNKEGKQLVHLKSAFALPLSESESIEFEFGEGLVGQVAASGKSMFLDELPEGYSNAIVSGLGMAAPKYIFITPVKKNNAIIGVMEIATFSMINEPMRKEAEEMARILAEQV
jgi:hypothetical protein